ncbi:hypothetical protein F2Q69_00033215, partial [Brassica cretica]
GVSAGPYCTVGSSVKVGNGCELYPSSHIFGNTELGESCVLMTLIFAMCQFLSASGAVVVGDELPGYTVIGGNNIIGHHAVVGVKCQHLKYKVYDYTHTAGATVIHQFCHIGPYAFIGGGSVISQDVPKDMMVTGERAKLRGLILEGLRRNGFTMSEKKSLRAAYRKIFMSTETVLKS